MKIVSLCPSLTELVFDLGLGDDLVGITDYCVHPADRVGAVETVGGTKTPDLARIIELAPDLILMNEEENRREDSLELEEAGLNLHSSFPKDPEGTAAMVRSIAEAVGRTQAGEEIGADIEQRSQRVRAEAQGKTPVRWAYLIWRKPWMAVNGDTFVHALLQQAGGQNVFAQEQVRYPEFTLQELVAADPQRVYLSSEPFPFEAKHVAELAKLTGLEAGRFQLVDGELLSWHGSRTPAGVDYAAELIQQAW